MDVKEWLLRGFKLNLEINQLLEAKERAKAMAENATALYGRERVQGGTGCKEDVILSYTEYRRLLFKQINRLMEISKEITLAISKVEDSRLRCILTARYINFKTWEEIAEDACMDLRWVYRLHKKALDEVRTVKKSRNA